MPAQPQSFSLTVADDAIADLRERLGRMAQPDEVRRVVVLLASDSAGFITRRTLRVNDGSYPA